MSKQGREVKVRAQLPTGFLTSKTNQQLAILQNNVRVWGSNKTKIETRNFLLRDIIRVEVHAKGGECSFELISRKADNLDDPFAQLERSIPFNSLDSKKVIKLAMDIEEKIKQFSDYKPTGIPPMANAEQIANILDQALLTAVVKREANFA